MGAEYTIAKSPDGWEVSVNGVKVLVCKRRNAALRAMRAAERADARRAASEHNGSTDARPPNDPTSEHGRRLAD
jgi:hypothetical protein